MVNSFYFNQLLSLSQATLTIISHFHFHKLHSLTNYFHFYQSCVAVLIGGLATFFCSILLIQGIRKVLKLHCSLFTLKHSRKTFLNCNDNSSARIKQPGCFHGLLSPASPPLPASSFFWWGNILVKVYWFVMVLTKIVWWFKVIICSPKVILHPHNVCFIPKYS